MTGSLPHPNHLVVAARTDRGLQRPENQDDFLVADLTVPSAQGGLFLRPDNGSAEAGVFDVTVGPRGVLLLVADGMGGAVEGGLASRLATDWIHEGLEREWARETDVAPGGFAECIRRAVEQTNDRLFRHSVENPELRGMGTTATVAGILEGVLILAQVGDSRAYLVRDGEAMQLTRDQSAVQVMVESGALTEEEASMSPQRGVILQALGPSPHIDVVLSRQLLRHGDTLLLCSDGLSGSIRKEEIARTLGAAADPADGGAGLVDLANRRGGPDNITVVTALIDH